MNKVVTESINQFYAHTRKDSDKSAWQRLIVHLKGTAQKAAEMGSDAGIEELARIAGLMHDLGKYSLAFQRRLEGTNQRVDHATAGAQEIWGRFGKTPAQKWQALMLAYAIAGHHGGLLDFGSLSDLAGDSTLQGRLKKEIPRDYISYKNELDLSALTLPPLSLKRTQNLGFSCSFLSRMLFSTLVDADWLDTETFCDGEKPRAGYDSIETLRDKLNAHLRQFENPATDINQKRTETLNVCREKADAPQGIFTLTIPTGGGKTLASMAFALNHAAKHGLKRVIYVIPFTSIIEQNAGVFKDFLGVENVLEHHSNFDWEQVKRYPVDGQDDETNNAEEKLKLAAENWDIPVVVTTNVQFFESLFANKKSRCRKLHNLAKSVIIFDEAQTLPREYLKPCMLAVQELVLNYGASAVFCTATQPVLKPFLPDIPEFMELIPNRQELFDFYKRVTVQQAGTLTDLEVLSRLNGQNQALCIVNTRRHAKGLFDGLEGDGKFHLSTLMCPAHRKKVLLEVRERLKNGSPCRVVSTQVMEAGIDVDFPIGYRALAGLDAIIQAAGRVNREGKNPNGDMFVFEPKTEFIKRTPTFIAQTGEAARSILREFGADPTTRQAIEAYFNLLLVLNDKKAFDAKEILADLNRSDGFDFKTAAEKFKLIENNTVSVIIPYTDEVRELVDRLAFMPHPTAILRKLQPYTVNIYEREFDTLNAQGAIEMAADTYAVLKDMSFYSQETGIILPASDGGAAIFFD
jgi:CRISPR-associated endonuclease/helicase Cas3